MVRGLPQKAALAVTRYLPASDDEHRKVVVADAVANCVHCGTSNADQRCASRAAGDGTRDVELVLSPASSEVAVALDEVVETQENVAPVVQQAWCTTVFLMVELVLRPVSPKTS